MIKETKLRLVSGALVVTMATTAFILNPQKAYAASNTRLTEGKFVEETTKESQFGQYVVKKGDNTSLISQKICRHLNVEMTTKYWPVIAFLNNFPKIIQPGDIIIFPNSIEEMDRLLNNLKDTGWLARYIQKNNVYGKKNKQVTHTVGELLTEIYGEDVCVDPDFVEIYLETLGLGNIYNINSPIDTNDMLFSLTEWIPTLQELQEFNLEKEYPKGL